MQVLHTPSAFLLVYLGWFCFLCFFSGRTLFHCCCFVFKAFLLLFRGLFYCSLFGTALSLMFVAAVDLLLFGRALCPFVVRIWEGLCIQIGLCLQITTRTIHFWEHDVPSVLMKKQYRYSRFCQGVGNCSCSARKYYLPRELQFRQNLLFPLSSSYLAKLQMHVTCLCFLRVSFRISQ